MLSLALPANEKRPKLVVPGVGALDDPATRLAVNAADERRLTPTANMRADSAATNFAFGVAVIESLVEA